MDTNGKRLETMKSRLRSVGRGRNDTGSACDDLRAHLHFSAETGQIWLHEYRMLLVHVEALASLRKELIDTLGMLRAQALFMRMGYTAGARDAELARTRAEDASDTDIFMTGPQLHSLEGVVNVTPIRVELDRLAGTFYGEFRWENAWEGQSHKRIYGPHNEPVCWSQIGYACGYTSSFMGRPVLYKEVECVGMGDNACRIIGKPVEEWDDASEYARIFDRESIADQLIDLQTQVLQLRSSINEKDRLPADMVGNSRGFRAAYELLRQAANSQIAVLLLGETGVGKELFARALHDHSARGNEPFVAINCAAIPHDLVESELFGVVKGAYTGALVSRPGRFERAHGGTLFLDEIGDLPPSTQAKLLRVLQEGEIERLGDDKIRKVNVRIVAATNLDLRQLVREGRFRADLYYRLNAYPIVIPPLRERKEDIALLAKSFLAKYAATHGKKLRGFSDKAKDSLLAYPWPGNIRELQNTVERGVILASSGSWVQVSHLFSSCGAERPREFGLGVNGELGMNRGDNADALCDTVLNGIMTLDQLEAMLLQAAVDKARGNLSAAARMLGLTRPQLAYRLKRRNDDAAADEAGAATTEPDIRPPQ